VGIRNEAALVVGCGTLGSEIADELCDNGYNVTVMDWNADAFHLLDTSFDGARITADATCATELEQAGAKTADIVIAVTDSDAKNVFIAETASAVFGVSTVYARVEDESIGGLLDDWNIELLCPHRLCLNEFASLEGLTESEQPA
jgi:trk system potassium uptake protein TrkA